MGRQPNHGPPSLSRAASSSSPSNDTTNNTTPHAVPWTVTLATRNPPIETKNIATTNVHNLDLQLSVGSSDFGEKSPNVETNSTPSTIKEHATEQLRLAMSEKAYAEEARREAKRQVELAEREFGNAKRIRQQAQVELEEAEAIKEHAMKQISSTLLQITCHSCKQQFTTTATATTMTSLVVHAEDQNSSLAESQVEDNNVQ